MRNENPWVDTKLSPYSKGEKVFNAAKIFLMGYGAYRLLGDIFSLGSRLFRRTRRRLPVHED